MRLLGAIFLWFGLSSGVDALVAGDVLAETVGDDLSSAPAVFVSAAVFLLGSSAVKE